MAVPSSGSLSLFGIAKEVHLDNYNNTVPAPGSGGTNWSQLGYPSISLGNMSTGAGGFDAINSASSSKPNGATPHSMSEFYGYDHDASALTLLQTITGQQHSTQTTTITTIKSATHATDNDGNTNARSNTTDDTAHNNNRTERRRMIFKSNIAIILADQFHKKTPKYTNEKTFKHILIQNWGSSIVSDDSKNGPENSKVWIQGLGACMQRDLIESVGMAPELLKIDEF